MADYTPQELFEAYSNGFPGRIEDPAGLERLLQSLPQPLFSLAAPNLRGAGEGKLSLPFMAVLGFDPNAYEEAQKTGDCVSHGNRNAGDISRAIQIINGANEGWIVRGATECIYGCRGHGGEGMTGSQAARFLTKDGGIALRQKYGEIDLSVYNANIGTRWGSRGGAPRELLEILQKNQIQTATLIQSVEEARDAIANGYGIAICSNYGFSSTRDKEGVSRKQGSWNHCMALTACDDTVGEIRCLIQNSWGTFNSGPRVHGQPEGSFWIHQEDADGMIRQGESFAFSMVNGFPPQNLPDYGAGTYL